MQCASSLTSTKQVRHIKSAPQSLLQRKYNCDTATASLLTGKNQGDYKEEADEVSQAVLQKPQPVANFNVSTPFIQRSNAQGASSLNSAPPPIAGSVLSSSGMPLDMATRSFFEPRFGHNFSQVRVHTDSHAAQSAREIGARAYTFGQNVVFGSGEYSPTTVQGKRLLAHELTHVIQQESASTEAETPLLNDLPGGGWSLRMQVHEESSEISALENEADAVAGQVVARDVTSPFAPSNIVKTSTAARQTILRTRMPVPPTPLCGKTLTDIEVLPPATKDLEPCLPKGVPFTRINIVGRDATSPSGKNQVFNVHAGYHIDATTGRYCARVDDSKSCLCPRCVFLGCFPTLEEVIEAIKEFLENVLKVLGILLLIAVMAIIIALLWELILVPAAAPLVPVAAVASAGEPDAQPVEGDGSALDETTSAGVA